PDVADTVDRPADLELLAGRGVVVDVAHPGGEGGPDGAARDAGPARPAVHHVGGYGEVAPRVLVVRGVPADEDATRVVAAHEAGHVAHDRDRLRVVRGHGVEVRAIRAPE